MEPIFFRSGAEMCKWLEREHAKAAELVVGFHKTSSGTPSITWPEAVDEALCFGWIDGVRRGSDTESYTIRFTPRKPRSTWSAVNIRRVGELIAMGRMDQAGLEAFDRRQESRSRIYAYEQPDAGLPKDYERDLRSNKKAWEFFQGQAPWYRRNAAHWVMSAKREDTRRRRLETLIEDSANRRRIRRLNR